MCVRESEDKGHPEVNKEVAEWVTQEDSRGGSIDGGAEILGTAQ